MKSVLFALVALLLATTACTAQDTTTPEAVRLRATTRRERQADGTWGADMPCSGVFVFKVSNDTFVYRWKDIVFSWYVTKIVNTGKDSKGHQGYRLEMVNATGDPTSARIRVMKENSRQIYLSDGNGREAICFETELL